MIFTKTYSPNAIHDLASDVGAFALAGYQMTVAPVPGHANGRLVATERFELTVHAPSDPWADRKVPLG